MEKSLARYIWSNTRLQQLWILTVVAVSMIPYFLSFDLPKQIVNGPIQGSGFEGEGATQTFMLRAGRSVRWLGNAVGAIPVHVCRTHYLLQSCRLDPD